MRLLNSNLNLLQICIFIFVVCSSKLVYSATTTTADESAHIKIEEKDNKTSFLYNKEGFIHTGHNSARHVALSRNANCAYAENRSAIVDYEATTCVFEYCRGQSETWKNGGNVQKVFCCPFQGEPYVKDFVLVTGFELATQDDKTIVVGCTTSNSISGVYVIIKNESANQWEHSDYFQLIPFGKNREGYNSPYSVAISDDGRTLAMGSSTEDGSVGAVWIFAREGKSNKWKQQGPKLVGNDHDGASRQGVSLSLSGDGDTLAVGGDGDVDTFQRGAVFIFHRNILGIWKQAGPKLVGSARLPGGFQGRYVELSEDGTTCVFGSSGEARGQMFAFRKVTGDAWVEQAPFELAGYENPEAQFFGFASLSRNGDLALLCGSNPAPTRFCSRNSCWIFKRDSLSDSDENLNAIKHQWIQQGPAYTGPGNASREGSCGEHYFPHAAYLSRDASHFIVGGVLAILGLGEDATGFVDLYRRNESNDSHAGSC